MTFRTSCGLAALALASAVSYAHAAPGRTAGEDARTAEVLSVTLDFKSEVKTTTMADGRVFEEAFDPRRMRAIASRPGRDGVVGDR